MNTPIHKPADFSLWLDDQLDRQEMSISELARAMGVSRANLSNVINRNVSPNLRALVGLVDTLGYELVVRKRK